MAIGQETLNQVESFASFLDTRGQDRGASAVRDFGDNLVATSEWLEQNPVSGLGNLFERIGFVVIVAVFLTLAS